MLEGGRLKLPPFELGDEEDLAARADRLEIGGLVDLAVDCDGGFFLEVVAEAGIEPVHFLDNTAQVFGLDRKFAHAAGVPPAEAGGEDHPRSHRPAPFCSHSHSGRPSPPPSRRERGEGGTREAGG